MRNKNKILVTGGNGFIGKHVTKHFGGYNADLPDHDITNHFDTVNLSWGITWKTIIHLAYINGTELFYTIPEEVLRVAVLGITNALELAVADNVDEFILASSSEVYQTPTIVPTPEDVPLIVPDVMNPRYSYGGGKIIAELMTINYGRKWLKKAMIFRPHNVYGPGMTPKHVIGSFITRMLSTQKSGRIEEFGIIGTGEETRSFVYVEDLVRGIDIIKNNGTHLNVYNIGTQDEIRIIDLARLIAERLHIKIERFKPTEGHLGGTNRRCPDISKIKKLGYQPKVSLIDGIDRTIEWFRKNNEER